MPVDYLFYDVRVEVIVFVRTEHAFILILALFFFSFRNRIAFPVKRLSCNAKFGELAVSCTTLTYFSKSNFRAFVCRFGVCLVLLTNIILKWQQLTLS